MKKATSRPRRRLGLCLICLVLLFVADVAAHVAKAPQFSSFIVAGVTVVGAYMVVVMVQAAAAVFTSSASDGSDDSQAR